MPNLDGYLELRAVARADVRLTSGRLGHLLVELFPSRIFDADVHMGIPISTQ